MHTLKDRVRRGSIAKTQKKIQRGWVDLRGSRHGGADGSHFRTEIESTPFDPVIEQFDTERITSKNQSSLPRVPEGQTEHAVEPVKHVIAPLFVAVDDDFGI